MSTINSNMNVSDILRIFKKIEDEYGDIPVIGECEDCTSSDMSIFILTDEKSKQCWVQVSTPEE